MAYRKIYIAVDCADDAQKDRVQQIAQELSQLGISGNDVEAIYPEFKKRRANIAEVVQYIRQNGPGGVKSFKFVSLISNLLL